MKDKLLAATLISTATLALSTSTWASDIPQQCRTVDFAEVGWTDITATTATSRWVLEAMGYHTTSQTASVPIAYAGLENGDFDVFLGNWMPSMASIIEPYTKKGTVETLRANLTGAKYTLAVPQYVYDAGVHSFSDLAEHRRQFNGRIYGIEAGNDGNLIIQSMIDDNAFDLKRFNLVESSEAGMLSEVKHSTQNNDWIVFLAWEPHPMNTQFNIAYLKGGDDYFGPNYGEAKIYTNTRAGYSQDCQNMGHFLNNLAFTLNMENQIMADIMYKEVEPMVAGKAWLKANPEILNDWLKGVTTVNGEPALPAVKAALNAQ